MKVYIGNKTLTAAESLLKLYDDIASIDMRIEAYCKCISEDLVRNGELIGEKVKILEEIASIDSSISSMNKSINDNLIKKQNLLNEKRRIHESIQMKKRETFEDEESETSSDEETLSETSSFLNGLRLCCEDKTEDYASGCTTLVEDFSQTKEDDLKRKVFNALLSYKSQEKKRQFKRKKPRMLACLEPYLSKRKKPRMLACLEP